VLKLDIQQQKELENYLSPKLQYGKSLPNPKSVSDGTPFYLLSPDGVYEECLMFKGKWCRKVADSNSRIVLEEI
jgi:hypothetical protein